ncbi:MAG: alpha/beta fold hydrolase [Ekhidna sp.]|uniref:alpha/beta hydrolase n=1 Tax=Ekhidna sp. TaxID=2608089 RepID=UPI0032EBF14F
MKHTLFIICLMLFSCALSQEFSEREVEIGEIKGTLSEPDKKAKVAILMISGSGPTDRDGNSTLGFTNNSLKMVAEQLASAGFAVLRYDKRGIAASKEAVENPSDHRFEHLVEDARNWLYFLNEAGYKRLIVVGHSQGSLVGMMAAQGNPNVKGFVSLAGLADDAGETIVRQMKAQSPALAEDAKVNIDSIKAGFEVKKFNLLLVSLFGPNTQPFLKSYIAYSPIEQIKKLDIPVLIINGTTDLQVDVDQAQSLHEASRQSELFIIEGMNHVLKDSPIEDTAANLATYNNPDLPLSQGLMDSVIKFIKKR